MTPDKHHGIHEEQFGLFDERVQSPGELSPVAPPAPEAAPTAAEQLALAAGGLAAAAEVAVPAETEPTKAEVLDAQIKTLELFGRENKSIRNIWTQAKVQSDIQETLSRRRSTEEPSSDPRFRRAQGLINSSRAAQADLQVGSLQAYAKALGIPVEVLRDPRRVVANDPDQQRTLETRYNLYRIKFAEPSRNKERVAELKKLQNELKEEERKTLP